MQKKTNYNSGITLIALIITIIVMLILVAVTVNTAINSGLFGHAKNAVDSWKAAEEKEANVGNGPITVGGVTYNSIDEYVASLPKKPETPETPDRTGLSVGDYVAYTPDTAANYTGLGTSATEADNPSGYKAGTDGNPTDGIPQDTTLAWRILSINNDGSVDIVSAKPTSQKVYFKGSIGFNNGVYLLNDLCASLYSNSTLGVTARSMNLIDIESKMNATGIAARDAYVSNGSVQYGNSKNYTGSNANAPDIYIHVGKTLAEETKSYYTAPTTLTHTEGTSLDVKQTYYYFQNTPASYFYDATFHELVFSTGASCWLASRCANCYTDTSNFGLCYVQTTNFYSAYLFASSNISSYGCDFVRPVVTLGANIQISAEGGTADNPRTLSK